MNSVPSSSEDRQTDRACSPWLQADEAAAWLADQLRSKGFETPPRLIVVLGSGWGPALGEIIRHGSDFDLSKGPGFRAPSVPGHRPVLRVGEVGSHVVGVQAGRLHLYEGVGVDAVAHPMRVYGRLGVGGVVLTNAAGSLRSSDEVGSLAIIADHLNLTGVNPLVGAEPGSAWSGRFVDMIDAYRPAWCAALADACAAVGVGCRRGVYAGLLGPTFETPAEIEMIRRTGADLVGFSTVCETIAARHAGLMVASVAMVTNLAAGLASKVNAEEVLAVGNAHAVTAGAAVRRFIEALPQ